MLTKLLRELAPFLAWEPVVYTIVGALVVWALVSGVGLHRATVVVRRAFAASSRILGTDADPITFAAAYEEISAELARSALLGSSWMKFRQVPVAEFGIGTAFVLNLQRIVFDTADSARFTWADAPTRIEQWPSTSANPNAARKPCFRPT